MGNVESQAADAAGFCRITVLWSLAPRHVDRWDLVFEAPHCTVAEVLARCQAPWAGDTPPARWPEAQRAWAQGALTLGHWGRPVLPTHSLQDGDRLEFWPALLADPKAARRARVAAQPRAKRAPLPSRRVQARLQPAHKQR